MEGTGRGASTTEQAMADETHEQRTEPWSTRRKALIAAGVFALAALAFVAGAGGLDAVFGEGDGVAEVRWDDAVVVAFDDDDGVVAQVLVAESRCVRVSVVDELQAVLSNVRCAEPLSPWDDTDFEIVRLDDYFGSYGQYPLQRADGSWRVALAGSVHPDIARATAHFGDGAQYSFVTRNSGGWFATLVPDGIADPDATTGYLVNAPVRLELFDAGGTRVASIDLTTEIGRTGGAA